MSKKNIKSICKCGRVLTDDHEKKYRQCRHCEEAAIAQDAKREMFGDDADYLSDDMGDK